MMDKQCVKCGKEAEKIVKEACVKCYRHELYTKNRVKEIAAARAWRDNNPDKVAAYIERKKAASKEEHGERV